MAYPLIHAVIAFGGPLFTLSGEEWSCSLRMSGEGAAAAGTEAGDDDVVNAYAAAITARWALSGLAGTPAKIAWVKYNRVGFDGKYLNPWTARKDYAVPISNNTASPHAAQVSMVATLRTAAARGLANSGRIFIPLPQHAIGADGRISIANRDASVTAVKALLDAINAVDATQHVVVGSKVREGLIRRVTRVEIGRTLDTMRSRRTSLPEEHAGQDLVAP